MWRLIVVFAMNQSLFHLQSDWDAKVIIILQISFTIDLIKCFDELFMLNVICIISLSERKYKWLSTQFFSNVLLFFERYDRFCWNVLRLLFNSFKRQSILKLEFSFSCKLAKSFINIVFCNLIIAVDESMMWRICNKVCAYFEMSMMLVWKIIMTWCKM